MIRVIYSICVSKIMYMMYSCFSFSHLSLLFGYHTVILIFLILQILVHLYWAITKYWIQVQCRFFFFVGGGGWGFWNKHASSLVCSCWNTLLPKWIVVFPITHHIFQYLQRGLQFHINFPVRYLWSCKV